MALPNGAARPVPSSSAPQSRSSDRGVSTPRLERRENESAMNGGSSDGCETSAESSRSEPPPPPPCTSSTNAFLLYCALPILLLSLASHINGLIAGEGGARPPASSYDPGSQSPGGGGGRGSGVTIDLSAAADAAREEDERARKQKRRRDQRKHQGAAGRRDGSGGGGADVEDSELKQEIDALLEKQGKKPPNKDPSASARQRHQRRDRSASSSREDQLEAARKRAQAQQDPRRRFDEQVELIRRQYKSNQKDYFRALALADALRQRDLTFHDGGSVQMEAIETYRAALELIRAKRAKQIEDGEPTDVALSGTNAGAGGGLNAELFLDVTARSTDGLLASVECSLGKMYFMANMFELSVASYDRALEIDSDYLDALTYRASTLIILGRYEEAAENYARVLELDKARIFQDAYTGLAKVLVAKESAVPGGWDSLVPVLEEEIPKYEDRLVTLQANDEASTQQKKATGDTLRDGLKRMHLAMFSYHDTKTNDTDKAWHHLSEGYGHKMDSLSPWNGAFEKQRVDAVKQVFHKGFWPMGVGSKSRVPIFIIGFVRSGSTLTERVLDAHPDVVGTGEDSVFNGRLDEIRNRIVEASVSNNPESVRTTVLELADMVVDGMRDRWEVIDSQYDAAAASDDSDSEGGEEGAAAKKAQKKKKKRRRKEPKRFVDKMLTNYMNVGFIHMLFPNSLILHVARNPMDTCFSAFKHDFPPGTLDYTSDFTSLADLYRGYRDVMDHWDTVLPGRVTHIKYEDMVNDMPNVSRKIIEAAGLEWHDDVLHFHKKKQAVNTLSTTQVRKGVYKHHLQAWKKYKKQLNPLVKLLGKRAKFDIKTTLPGYEPPKVEAMAKTEAIEASEPKEATSAAKEKA